MNETQHDALVCRQLLITGQVQGVAFRKHTKYFADALNVTGWVRNLDDGAVQVCVSGASDAVAQLIAWCHHGPERARVSSVTVDTVESWCQYEQFVIAR